MVIGKRMKAKLLKSLEKWYAEASTTPKSYWDVGDCDICNHEHGERLEKMEEWFPGGKFPEDDPPWLFCEEHARELGILW